MASSEARDIGSQLMDKAGATGCHQRLGMREKKGMGEEAAVQLFC